MIKIQVISFFISTVKCVANFAVVQKSGNILVTFRMKLAEIVKVAHVLANSWQTLNQKLANVHQSVLVDVDACWYIFVKMLSRRLSNFAKIRNLVRYKSA